MSNRGNLKSVTAKYAYRVTEHIKSTIRGTAQDDPVAKQYVPQIEELDVAPEERFDPIGDDAHSPVPGIVHRYPDRVLLKITNICAVYCRYCFRKEMIGPGSDILSEDNIQNALAYIRSHEEVWEVILTGGDPLVLSPRRLKAMMAALQSIPHVQIIRIHTRVPVADPKRITAELTAALGIDKPVYSVIHVNHAQECTEEVAHALNLLHRSGINLLSQSVLLKGVNDDAQTLEELFRTLVAHRVKPYYLHHPDLVHGSSHFRVPIARGQEIMRQLQGQVSGLCLPRYVLDIPGGFGKVPIADCYAQALDDGFYRLEDYKGYKHLYPPKA